MDKIRKQPLFFHTVNNFDQVRLILGSRAAGKENPLWYIVGIMLILAIFSAAYFLA